MHDAPQPVQRHWGLAAVGESGHDAAGRHVVGIERERLPGAQGGVAIIAAGQKRLGILLPALFLVVPVTVQANPERPGQRCQHQQDDDRCHKPGAKPVIRISPAVVTIYVRVPVMAKPGHCTEHFPANGVSLNPIQKTILISVFVHLREHIRPPAVIKGCF